MALRGRPIVQSVAVGEWIRIPVPGEPWPVRMQVGPNPPVPAFLDHERNNRGEWRTVVALRCPPLTPGRYDVRVFLPDTVVEAVVTVS